MTRKLSILIIALSICLLAGQSFAASYSFNVLYNGSSAGTLVAGSDDPLGVNMQPGDSYVWTISAKSGYFWKVLAATDIFPLAAFPLDESATRTGDFTLTLLKSGATSYTVSETGAVNSYVHLGTNTVSLASGIEFDTILLSYAMTGIYGGTDSTINSILPIFGTPEVNMTVTSGSIIFTNGQASVPVPAAVWLLGSGLLGLCGVRRKIGK